jgi:steroid Delta-isomerase
MEVPMLDDAAKKEKTLEYARLMNAGDVEGVLALFADDVVFEDPVGAPPIRGKEALRRHIAWSVACNTHEMPGVPVTSMDGRWVAAPTTVEVFIPEKITFDIIGLVEVGDDDQTRHVRTFWGVSNAKVGDGPDLEGIEHVLTVADHFRKMDLRRPADPDGSSPAGPGQPPAAREGQR